MTAEICCRYYFQSCREMFTAWREKMWVFLHKSQQTSDLKFSDQLKVKSTTWLYFTLHAVLAHNPFSLRAQEVTFPSGRLIRNWICLAIISECIHFALLHHAKTTSVSKKIWPALMVSTYGSYSKLYGTLQDTYSSGDLCPLMSLLFEWEPMDISCLMWSFQRKFLLLKQQRKEWW